MTTFAAGIVIGLFIGGALTTIIMCLCQIAGKCSRQEEQEAARRGE